jgi:hypothetical protein
MYIPDYKEPASSRNNKEVDDCGLTALKHRNKHVSNLSRPTLSS